MTRFPIIHYSFHIDWRRTFSANLEYFPSSVTKSAEHFLRCARRYFRTSLSTGRMTEQAKATRDQWRRFTLEMVDQVLKGTSCFFSLFSIKLPLHSVPTLMKCYFLYDIVWDSCAEILVQFPDQRKRNSSFICLQPLPWVWLWVIRGLFYEL